MIGGKTPDQIVRADCKGGFFEICNSMLDTYGKGRMGKVLINLCKYNDNFKQEAQLPIYIEIPRFLTLVEDVRMGKIQMDAAKERERIHNTTGNVFPNYIWRDIKITPKEKLRQQRHDGMDEVRLFEIKPATKTNIPSLMLVATRCGGTQTDKGEIKYNINYKEKTSYEQVIVTVSEDDFRGALLYTKMHIQAFLNWKWSTGCYQKTNNNQDNQNENIIYNQNNNKNVSNFRPDYQRSALNNKPIEQKSQMPEGKVVCFNTGIFGNQEINDDEEYPFVSNP